ncbi:TIGR01210 family protein [Aciduliprofundum sp. MAR08-339]|uniref:archaeosine biosynthesis radical SAM protein RaSEA n=1 Tax=Aciduliprofundum sp. (strain MAR08-339) TaxID=673860 RepID=UPI0002A4A587|nr:TIGR01210 family protein [Aciduliprofundum sp. MAR08-339]
MEDLQKMIREIRKKAKRREKSGLIASWTEKDRLNGKVVDSFVIILRTRGCRWAYHSGCSMCGYFNDTNPRMKEEDLLKQVEEAKNKYNGEPLVKVFTSGSFLDDWEVPPNAQNALYDAFSSAKRIIVESRPEYVTEERVREVGERRNVMVALGLESANNETLERRINKGFTVEDYVRAAELLRKHEVPVKTYVLLKPPFMTERQAIEEAIYSVEFASRYSEIVSVNPMNIQNYTLVEYLWRRGEYRAPWLWSVVEVLKRTSSLGVDVVSYPTAGGKVRGAHNCGKCDARVLEAIENYSLTQDISHLENLNCTCRERWKKIVEYEDYLWDYTYNS